MSDPSPNLPSKPAAIAPTPAGESGARDVLGAILSPAILTNPRPASSSLPWAPPVVPETAPTVAQPPQAQPDGTNRPVPFDGAPAAPQGGPRPTPFKPAKE